MNEVESYMNQKGVEYRTIDKSRAGRIYERLKPHISLPKRTIQVLGTNGKGSTGRFLTLMLMQNGASVLHFTSPHIFSFSERFYKNGAVVGDDELTRAHRFLQGFEFMKECSYFEYATFLACVLAQGVDYLILEAGVGGELDSTSVIPRDLCVFSVIDYDHTEILGESIEEIATTKLNAVFYPNRVSKMVLGVQKYVVVEKIAKEIAKVHNITLYFGNSPLELHSADSANFECSQTPSLVSHSKFAENYESQTENPSVVLNNENGESTNQTQNCNNSLLRGRITDSHEAIQTNQSRDSATLKALSGAGVGVVREGEGSDFAIQAPTPSLKENARGQKGRFNADLSVESCKKIDSNVPLDSQDSFSQKGCTPHPAPPTRQKLPLFAFRGRASLSPILAKNRHSHYCSFESDFLHHESGEIRGATHDSFFVDCFESATPNLAMTEKMLNCIESRNDELESYLAKHHLADFLKPNLNLALKALEILGQKCDFKTLPKLDLRGRFEQIAPNIIIDVGHNQNAAFAIRQNLGQKKVILVYNSYFQKNISEILGILKDNILRVEILRVADNPRIIEQKSLEQTLESLGILYQNFGGIDSMDSQNDYLVFGSFSVVEAFMRDYYRRANQK